MALLLDRGSCDYGRNSALAHRLFQDLDLSYAAYDLGSRHHTTASSAVRKSSTMLRHRQRAGALVGKASLGISARTDQVSDAPPPAMSNRQKQPDLAGPAFK